MNQNTSRRGSNAVKGKKGFQTMEKQESSIETLTSSGDFLRIPVGELRVGDKVYDKMVDDFWPVISIDNDHKTTSVEVERPEVFDGFMTFKNDENIAIYRLNS